MDVDTTAVDQAVAGGTAGDVSVTLVAPDSEGTYTGYWRLADEDGNVFGQSVYVMIVISEDAATLTPTPTSTDEETATSELTPTLTTASEATATLEPTFTPMPTSSSRPMDLITDTPTPVSTESS